MTIRTPFPSSFGCLVWWAVRVFGQRQLATRTGHGGVAGVGRVPEYQEAPGTTTEVSRRDGLTRERQAMAGDEAVVSHDRVLRHGRGHLHTSQPT
jgi:hypothetical protein